MSLTFRSPDCEQYKMSFRDPHRELEPEEREIAIVDEALAFLCDVGVLPGADYDRQLFREHRQAVRDKFDIPWTAITPRQQRLLYAINAIKKPRTMMAAGIFCGNTFISNAAAGAGPGACYEAEHLVGIEIRPEEAERARANMARLGIEDRVEILAADAVQVAADWPGEIDVLYLDADGAGGRGKSVYLDIVEAAIDRLPSGSLVLAHNSVNSAKALSEYLDYMRCGEAFAVSVNVVLDDQGLEVSRR